MLQDLSDRLDVCNCLRVPSVYFVQVLGSPSDIMAISEHIGDIRNHFRD